MKTRQTAAPLHLLMTTDTVGGVWQYSINLSEALSRRGHRITLVTLGDLPNAAQMAQVRALPNVVCITTRFKLEWMHDPWTSVAESSRFVEALVKQLRPTLLHTNQYCFGSLASTLEVPVVVAAHSDVLSWCAWCLHDGDLYAPVDDYWLRYRQVVQEGLQTARAIVAPSAFMRDMLLHYYRPPAPIHIIYNGCGTPYPPRPVEREPLVVTVGRVWDIAKNVPLVEEAVEMLPPDIRARFVVVGPRAHPDHGEAWPACSERIEYIDYLPHAELMALLQRARIYIAAPRYEPFGLTTLEAALSGCTILANDTPFFRELWGDCATFFEHNSAYDLAVKLATLLQHPEQVSGIESCAYQRAIRHYSLDALAENYLALYEQICGSRSLPEDSESIPITPMAQSSRLLSY